METEAQLIREIVNGRQEKFRLLVEQYQNLVNHMVSRMVNNPSDREELCQDVFVKIYKNLPGFEFQSKLSTWIAKIAYNTCINYLKKKKVMLYNDLKTRDEDDTDPEGFNEKFQSSNAGQDLNLNQKELSGIIHHEIERLPVNYRIILTLYHLDELSYQEIGEILEMPMGTVKNYLFRARKHLKNQLLKKYAPEELCP